MKKETLWLNNEQSKKLYKIAFSTNLYQRKLAEQRRRIVSEARLTIEKCTTYCKHCGKKSYDSHICDKCSYQIHRWIRAKLPKPEICQKCGFKKELNLTNNSQFYYYDLSDWEYLCTSCHSKKDGPLRYFYSYERNKAKCRLREVNELAVDFVKDEIRRNFEKDGVGVSWT